MNFVVFIKIPVEVILWVWMYIWQCAFYNLKRFFLLDLEPWRSICFHTLLQKYWEEWPESWICHYSLARGAVWFYQYYRYYYSVVEKYTIAKIALLDCTLDYQIIMKFNLVIEKQHIVFWEILRPLTLKCRIKKPSKWKWFTGVHKVNGSFLKKLS